MYGMYGQAVTKQHSYAAHSSESDTFMLNKLIKQSQDWISVIFWLLAFFACADLLTESKPI